MCNYLECPYEKRIAKLEKCVKVVAEPKPEPKLTPVDLDALRIEISNAIVSRTPSIGLSLLPHFFMAINLVFAKYKEGNK